MYWDLFRNFFHIGLFTIGGGYAMIPLIQQKVVQQKQWVSEEELVDLMAVAQSCPGIFAVNISIFIGYKLRGVKGALCSTLGACLPSFLIILAIATLFQQFKDNEWVARFFRGIRPAVVGLLAAAALLLMTEENFGSRSECPWQFWISVGIFLFAFIGQRVYKMGPILLIVLCGLTGMLLL